MKESEEIGIESSVSQVFSPVLLSDGNRLERWHWHLWHFVSGEGEREGGRTESDLESE
jgi:hypothetical protein